MNKKYFHHLLKRLHPFHIVYFFLVFLALTTLTVITQRQNSLTAVQLQREVYQADKAGTDVEASLQRLRSYVYGHMNTSLTRKDGLYPPTQLQYTYERLQKAEQDKVRQANSQIYTDAQAYCEQQHPTGFSGSSRIACIEQYVSEHGTVAKKIPDSLYKFDFTSPSWSPDLAGWITVAAALSAILLVLRIIAGFVLKRLAQ